MTKNRNNTAAVGPATAAGASPPTPVPQVRDYVQKAGRAANPLNDPALATTLLQINSPSIATQEQFDEKRTYHIYVPKKLATDFANAPAGGKPKARVSLFFGVGPEMDLFRLTDFFANESASVLITIPGVEAEDLTVVPASDDPWRGIHKAFGYGISTAIIKKLMTLAGLDKIDFNIEVMAGYSTGYRGTNLTIINQMVDISKLTRVIYLDAWYHHDDHPLAPAPSPYRGKNTLWAIDTALQKSPGANVVIYAFTHPGGVPRSNPGQTNQNIANPPSEPVNSLITKYPGHIFFIDFEFTFNGKPHIDDQLEKICLARLISVGHRRQDPTIGRGGPADDFDQHPSAARFVWRFGTIRLHRSLWVGRRTFF